MDNQATIYRKSEHLFFCFLIDDIFWVFCSSNLFGENVMVEVATKAAENPIHNGIIFLDCFFFSGILNKNG
jgi:hypothetical protein